MNFTSIRGPQGDGLIPSTKGRALVMRIGALGDVLLTRRLTCSLFLAGFRSTLFAPARHASILLGDPWIDAVLDSESPELSAPFGGHWPDSLGRFDVALSISNSKDLFAAAGSAADSALRISPAPGRRDVSIARQWADAAGVMAEPFLGPLPNLTVQSRQCLVSGATLIHPGSGSPLKNWPVERFAELGRVLSRGGAPVHWIRGPAERDIEWGASGSGIIDRPSLEALAATLAQATVFVGNDSGVSHMAAAVGAPTVVIFGSTEPNVWQPDGPRVRALRAPSCDLSDVHVVEVQAAIADVTRLQP